MTAESIKPHHRDSWTSPSWDEAAERQPDDGGDPAIRQSVLPVSSPNRTQVETTAPVLFFDVAGPLVAYYCARAVGLPPLPGLMLSGLLPAFGVAVGLLRRRHLDALGVVVVFAIVAGAILGWLSGRADLVLLDGALPGVVFGAGCLASLWSRRPLSFRFAWEAIGAHTSQGRDFEDRWRYPGFRHAFQVTTVVWGLASLTQAVAQIVIVETASAETAKATSNLMPLVVAAVVGAWSLVYAKRGQHQGALAAKAAHDGRGKA